MQDAYAAYGANFTRTIFYSHKHLTEQAKFRSYVGKETIGGISLYEALCSPLVHVRFVSQKFRDARLLIANKKFSELALDMQALDGAFETVIPDTEALVNMALRIQDLPPAV